MHAGKMGYTHGNVRIEYTVDTHDKMVVTMLKRDGGMWRPIGGYECTYAEWCGENIAVHTMRDSMQKGVNDGH